MANEEHLAILRQGLEDWNKWRKENPEVSPNLKEASLRGVTFPGINPADTANLSKAIDLVNANLRSEIGNLRSNFHFSNFRTNILPKINVPDVNFAKLRANLRANLGFVNLSGADLSFADFSFADLRGADLSFADLGFADLRGADLR